MNMRRIEIKSPRQKRETADWAICGTMIFITGIFVGYTLAVATLWAAS